MANLSGTNLAAAVVPFTTEDTYPTHMAAYGKGGWRSVEDLDELYTIPTLRLEYGCVAYVKGENKPYIYKDGNWSALDLGGGSEIVVDSELSPTSTNPIQNQAVANALGGKADSSTVSGIDTRVGTLETTITSKADNSALEALQAAVESINTSIPMVVVNGNESGDFYINSNEYSILAGNFIEYITIWKNYVEIEGAVNHYMIRFTYKSEDVSVHFADWELQWAGGNEPEWEVGKTYEVSIIDNIALWAEIG